jgi:2'-5' RNA ligase
MRLFIAIDFGKASEFFKEVQSRLDLTAARLTLTKSYHLTIKFLGEVDETNVNIIKERLSNIKFAPFFVRLANLGVFPSQSHIRVIWLGFEDDSKLKELQEQVEISLKDIFPKDDFKAHITLARVKEIIDKQKLRENLRSMPFEKKDLEINEFKLMKSTLLSTGPVYEEVTSFRGN